MSYGLPKQGFSLGKELKLIFLLVICLLLHLIFDWTEDLFAKGMKRYSVGALRILVWSIKPESGIRRLEKKNKDIACLPQTRKKEKG
jgi:hypothetical protein